MTDDLLSLLIEVTSVTASGRQLKKPLTLPRPQGHKGPQRPATRDETDAAYKRGVAVLASTSKRVSR